MGDIIYIEDYRNKKNTRLDEAKAELRRILEPLGTWKSPEEELRFHMEQAERDRPGGTGGPGVDRMMSTEYDHFNR